MAVGKENNIENGTKLNISGINKKQLNIPSLYISLSILVLLVIVLNILNRSFLSRYNLGVVADAATILLCVGGGQMYLIITGGIDLSIGGIMSMVSVVFLTLVNSGMGYWAYLIALGVGIAAGLINGILYTKLKIPSFICTLGTNGIFVSFTYLLAAAPISASIAYHPILDVVNGKTLGITNGWLIALIMFALFFVIQRLTYWGKMIVAVGSNETMCYMSGVDIDKTKIIACVLSGIGGAVGAIVLSSFLYSAYPTIGEVYIMESIAVVVVGGTAMTGGSGGMINTLVGALIMSMLKNGMTVIGVDVYAQQTFLGILLILAVAATFDRNKLIFIK